MADRSQLFATNAWHLRRRRPLKAGAHLVSTVAAFMVLTELAQGALVSKNISLA